MENSKRKIKKGVKYLSLMPIYNASKQRMLLREIRNEAYGQSRNFTNKTNLLQHGC